MHRSLAVVALAVTGLFASAASGQTTRTVCASGCQYTSINAAIDDANNGDVIQLSAETYFEGEQIDTDGKAITLRGVLDKAGEPASVLDGSGTHRVLICQSGETSKTVFQNLVIQNGWSGSGGGGMFNTGSSPTLTDCTFTGNSAAEIGGGMFNTGSSPTLTNCSFEINSADYVGGGGMANQASSSPTLSDCTFTNNSADYNGGGMFNITNSSPTLNDCTFAGNSATNGYGGGMYNHRGTPPLTGCTFTSNSAERSGGGMFNLESSPPLTGCTFTSNSAERFGGGMFN
ncbi:MAG: right-handed parallel beta-helix repeat-containing protein, partial [Planctomycetota bacterium]|nr:right-handed parallel beta-helix repeat-containing protein [Planctomycetota bacterium]